MRVTSRGASVTRPFLTAEWRHLAMFNFRVSPGQLAPFVPRGTVLDAWHGETWVSIVGFQFRDTRVLGLPIPWHRTFPEVNLRFYVRPAADERRAVVFLREIVPRRAIALTARVMYNEPYVTRRMRTVAPARELEAPFRVQYEWRNAGRWNAIGVTASGPPRSIEDGSIEAFITEHYWGYTAQRDGSTVEYQVAHPPWRIWPVREITFDVDVVAEYGPRLAPLLMGSPASVFLADGSAVSVGHPRQLAPAAEPTLG